ncbi:hypothetical protein FD724_00610 [Nostoc sp. C057]|uniref:hypothetical protein n=1 Tax=Nostoc sp. C057 TaxID=2576903 RepID=UPI0015C3D0A5|nr:hypothetical protein [Nostoc sp. C057]QLE46810.1 hypothetical protein FD724_00610 [Nostoc sp. C057]
MRLLTIALPESDKRGILRVSANPKFASQPLNSQTCDSRNPETQIITYWIKTYSQMSVAPIAQKADKVKSSFI